MNTNLKSEFYNLVRCNEEYFDFMQNQAQDGLWFLNLHNHKEIWKNPKFFNIIGYSQEEIHNQQKNWKNYLHPEDLNIFLQTIEQCITNKQNNFETTLRFIHKKKSIIWLKTQGILVYDENQNPSHAIVGFLNVSWETPEQSSAFLKEHLEDFFSMTEELFCIANVDGFFMEVNRAWEKTLGYTMDDLKNSKFLDLIHPDDINSTLEALKTLEEGTQVLNFTNRYTCKDGTYKTLEWQSFPKDKLIYAVARDITEKLRVEKQLKESEEMLLNLANNLPGVILKYELHPDGTDSIPFINKGVQKIYNISQEEAISEPQKIWSLTHPDDLPRMLQTIEKSAKELSLWQCEWRIILQDNTIKWLLGRGTPKVKPDGTVHWDTVTLDITEQKHLEQKIQSQYFLLKGIIESSRDPIFAINKDYQYTIFNEAHRKYIKALYGFEVEEFGNSLDNINSEKSKKTIKKSLNKVLNGQYLVEEAYFGKESDEKRFLEITQNPIIDHDGQVQGAAFFAIDITQEKIIKQKLIANEERFRALVENSKDIYLLCRQDLISYVSPNITEILGYSQEEFMHLHLQSIIHSDDLPLDWKALEAPSSTLSLQFRARHKTGKWHHFEVFAKNLCDFEHIGSIVFILTDRTLRHEAEKLAQLRNQELAASEEQLRASEEALKANLDKLTTAQKSLKAQKAALQISEEKYRKVVETQNDYIMLSSPDSTITFVNITLAKSMGKSVDEMIGKKWIGFAPLEDLNFIENEIAELSPKHDFFIWENRELRANNQYAWTQWVNQGVFDAHGTLIQIQSVGRDITELKKTQIALKQSEQEAQNLAWKYKSILDNQSIYMITITPNGYFMYFNSYFDEKFNCQTTLRGMHFTSCILESDHTTCLETLKKCIQEPQKPHSVILHQENTEGLTIATKWEFKGILDDRGKLIEILCVGFDITEQLDSLQRLEKLLDITSEQNTRLQNFAYIISHNIRSHSANMTSLLTFIKTTQDKEEKDLYFNLLEQSTYKLDETITNLNEILTIHGNFNKPKESRNLKIQTSKTLEILSGSILQKNIHIYNEVEDYVVVDVIPSYLESILLNVISNSIKYYDPSEPYPFIKITTKRVDGYTAVLSVFDNGLGIDLKKNANKIFGMYKTFHQNDDARGLGLFITKNQIEAMGGKIDLESELGVGTTFNIYFSEKN